MKMKIKDYVTICGWFSIDTQTAMEMLEIRKGSGEIFIHTKEDMELI